MRIRLFQTAGVALALLLSTGLASAMSAQGGPGRGMGLERDLDQLGLSKETRASVQKILDDAKPQAEQLRTQIRSAHEKMRGLLDKDPVDESAVMAQADEVGKLMTEDRKLHLSTLIHVRALLTPEQRAQLTKLMQEHGPGGPHGPGGHRGGYGKRGPGMQGPGGPGAGPQGPGGPQGSEPPADF
jgi:Spy/CpxP family protein refolding chaperone